MSTDNMVCDSNGEVYEDNQHDTDYDSNGNSEQESSDENNGDEQYEETSGYESDLDSDLGNLDDEILGEVNINDDYSTSFEGKRSKSFGSFTMAAFAVFLRRAKMSQFQHTASNTSSSELQSFWLTFILQRHPKGYSRIAFIILEAPSASN